MTLILNEIANELSIEDYRELCEATVKAVRFFRSNNLVEIELECQGVLPYASYKAFRDALKDKTGSEKIEKQGSNMMLNAESATVPREINIGLPAGSNGATAFIDGANGSYALPNAYQHWVGSNGFESAGSVPLMETVIRLGNIGIMVKSNTRLGTEQTKGTFTAGTSTNGLIRFDGSLTGPLSKAKGWYYSLGAFINYDPTNVNTPSRKFVEQMQMYQASLSKRWADSSLDFIYRLSHCNTTKNTGYTDAPFIYNGDGSISPLNGFRIGKDCYFPADDAVKYMDLQSGQMRSAYMSVSNCSGKVSDKAQKSAFLN